MQYGKIPNFWATFLLFLCTHLDRVFSDALEMASTSVIKTLTTGSTSSTLTTKAPLSVRRRLEVPLASTMTIPTPSSSSRGRVWKLLLESLTVAGVDRIFWPKRSSPGVANVGKRQVSVSKRRMRCGVGLTTGDVKEMSGLDGDLFSAFFHCDLCRMWFITAFETIPGVEVKFSFHIIGCDVEICANRQEICSM